MPSITWPWAAAKRAMEEDSEINEIIRPLVEALELNVSRKERPVPEGQSGCWCHS